jgi:hypothetical protein
VSSPTVIHAVPLRRQAGPLRWVVPALFLLAIGLVTLYAGLVVIGAVDPVRAAGASAVVGALAVAWIGRAAWDRRHAFEQARDPRQRAARERRGF